MKHYFLLISVLAISSGCDVSQSFEQDNKSLVRTAQAHVGLNERTDRQELKSLLGIDPVYYEWCAAFVNAILELENIPSNKDHKYPLTARAFLDWGDAIQPQDIRKGDLVIFPRGSQGWQGHVGFYITTETIRGKDYYLILGGNQSNQVKYDLYPANYALGIRRYPRS